MLSSLLLLATARAAEPCPSVEAGVASAEKDALSFFLADAQASLVEAAKGFSCARAQPPLLARYWLAQAMVWHLQEREGEADSALAAAKAADGTVYTIDLGDELRALWEAAEVRVGETVAVKIRGMKRDDTLLVDAVEMPEPSVVPGLHVFQVVRGGEVVYGRVVDVPAEGMELMMAETVSGGGSGELALPQLTGPLSVKGPRVLDGQGQRVAFHGAVLPLSLVVDGGVDNFAQRRRNGRLQAAALGTAAVGTWVGYLFGWDLVVGENLPRGRATALTGAGVLIAGAGLTWEGVLLSKRRSSRKRAVELANTALESK